MSVYQILKRDIGSQFRYSVNLRESWPMKLKRCFWATVYLLKAFLVAVKAMRREQLGSIVIHDDRLWAVSNWSNGAFPNLKCVDGEYKTAVPRDQIENVHSLPEFWHRFKFGLGFYTGSHYANDVNRKLYWRVWKS